MSSHQVLCFVALGSNLQEPIDQVRRAFAALAALPRTQLRARSSLYRSKPLGPVDQPHYINAVAALQTALPALDLLEQLQRVERDHGRIRTRHWGPRTLDLDLLLYGELVFESERLTLPHPGLSVRSFVLYPLLELAPELSIEGLGTLRDLARACPADDLQRLEPE